MLFANDYDIAQYVDRYRTHPVLGKAARMLAAVAHDAGGNSDGWCYWPAPCRATKQLQILLQRGDATEAEYRKALGPIRSFYTRAHAGKYGSSYPAMLVLADAQEEMCV